MSTSVGNGTWAPTKLSAIAQVVRERVKPQDHPELPFIGMDNVEAHTMRLLGTVPASTMKSASVHFRAGDVLYGRLRPYLNKVLAPGFEGLASAEFIPLTAHEGVVPEFIQYRINAADFVAYASQLDEGDRPRVDYDQIGAFEIELPPSPQQRRIVASIESYFTRLDDAVATLERVQRNLKRYRASVLKAAVEGRLVPTEAELARVEGRSYEPASVLLERIVAERRRRWEEAELVKMKAKGNAPNDDRWKVMYKEPVAPETTDLPELPEGWCWSTAEALSDETRSITYGVVKLGAVTPGGVPTLRSSNIRHLRLDLDYVKPISKSISTAYQRTVLSGSEVLVTVRGTLGGVVATLPTCVGFNISREVAMIALVEPLLAPSVATFIASDALQKWILRRTRGIAYTGINIATLKQLPIPVPPLAEQARIVEAVEHYLSIASATESMGVASVRRCQSLRQSILRWAFEGHLVDQDPTDEPAYALLERIRAKRTSSDVTRLGRIVRRRPKSPSA